MADIIKASAADVYGRMADPLVAIETLGKAFQQSQLMGVTTPGDGQVLALTCMCEGITPLEFSRTYHIINGRPAMRADMMHAKFREAGGKVEWKNVGDDGKRAEAVFSFGGQSLTVAFTIDDAVRMLGEKIKKPGSNWASDPGAMLRARLISKAVRILAPEIVAGVYTPEDLAASQQQDQPQRSATDLAARQAELDAAASQTPPDAAETTAAEIVDVQPEEPAKATTEQLQRLVAIASKLPSPSGSGRMTVQEIGQRVCDACKVDRPQDATAEQIDGLIAKVEQAVSRAG
jgi:hypothetical protein